MEDYKEVFLDEYLIVFIPQNTIILCVDNNPIIHFNKFDIEICDCSYTDKYNITFQPVFIECQDYLKKYVIKHFKKNTNHNSYQKHMEEEYKNINLGDFTYLVPVNMLFLCHDKNPFAHISIFDISNIDHYNAWSSKITLQSIYSECPEYLILYIKKNFKKVNIDKM